MKNIIYFIFLPTYDVLHTLQHELYIDQSSHIKLLNLQINLIPSTTIFRYLLNAAVGEMSLKYSCVLLRNTLYYQWLLCVWSAVLRLCLTARFMLLFNKETQIASGVNLLSSVSQKKTKWNISLKIARYIYIWFITVSFKLMLLLMHLDKYYILIENLYIPCRYLIQCIEQHSI